MTIEAPKKIRRQENKEDQAMKVKFLVSVIAAFGILFFHPTTRAAEDPTSSTNAASPIIKLIHFPGGTALPLYVAEEKGFFKAEGLTVVLTPTFDSRQLMIGILQKKYEIGDAAIDNLIAYDEKQAAPNLDVTRDLVAFMATSSTDLSLIVQPSIRSYADLKGKTLAVDAPTTGFAFVLRKMLQNGGLRQKDYSFLSVGGDSARLAALRAGKVAGSLLTSGFANQAMAAGLRRLGTSLDVLHHYEGTSLFTRRSWAQAHRGELVKFIRALLQANSWIFDPSHKAEAARILAKNSNGMSPSVAEKTIEQLTSSRGGLSRTGALDIEGIKVVLALRSQYAVPKKTLNDPKRYIDTSYYDEAEKSLRR